MKCLNNYPTQTATARVFTAPAWRLPWLLFLVLIAAPFAARAQSVGIGTPTPDASAALEVASTARGLLVPRLTAAQRTGIAAPATGLLVYQTNGPQAGFYYNAGPPAAPAWTFLNPVGGADNLGNHTATMALNLQGQVLTGTGASVGAAVGVGVRADGGLNLGQNTVGNNVYLGYLSGAANTTGFNNTFTGTNSGAANTTGYSNIFAGSGSGLNNTEGFSNTFAGAFSGEANTTGFRNTFAGFISGADNTTGSNNTFAGAFSGANNTTGDENILAGAFSGQENTSGSGNTFAGVNSGRNNTTGNDNTFTGRNSGDTNTTGRNNTFVGSGSDAGSAALRNATALGYRAVVTASNKVRLGNTAVTVVEGQVAYSFPSDARFKYDVRADVPGLAFITKLRPVTYRFDAAGLDRFGRTGALPAGFTPDPAAAVQTGFLAQDVEAAARAVGFVFDGVHRPAGPRDHYSLAYSQFVMPLVRAVQELSQEVETLRARNAAQAAGQAARLDQQQATLLALQAQVARLLGAARPDETAPAATAQARP